MRVHHLTVTAFGPFADTQFVDFDQLNDNGMFLLTGPTGAGKTSVLDAVCFALFGAVPGDRNQAKSLKSHHAVADVRPEVVLEVTVRGRRFLIRRSPAWRRPSTRARAGYVDEQPRAVLTEWRSGGWEPLSNRLDEIGHLITRTLGMSRDQFCQVVMLPQGRFQTFLNSGAKERHDVLEALFDTGRFQRIEKWLADHRRDTERAYDHADSSLRLLANRAEEVCGVPLSAAAPIAELSLPDIEAAMHAVWSTTTAEATAAAASARAAAAVRKERQHALDHAKSLQDRQERVSEARRTLDELRATQEQADARQLAITRARRAEKVWPFVELLDEADAARSMAEAQLADAQRAVREAGVVVSSDGADAVEAALERTQAQLAAVTELASAEAELVRDRGQLAELEQAVADARHEADSLERRSAELPAEVEALRSSLAAHRAVAAELTLRQQRGDDSRAAAAAAIDAARLRAQIDELSVAATSLQTASLEAKQHWLSIRETYLDGIAAVLAEQLHAGGACPVCGAVDHPAPAKARPGQVTADDEAAALQCSEAADELASGASVGLATARQTLAVTEAAADGLRPAAARRAAVRAEAAVAEAEAAAARVEQLGERQAQLELEGSSLNARCAQLASALAVLVERESALRAAVGATQDRLVAVLGPTRTVAERSAELRSHEAALRGLTRASARLEQATDARRDRHERFDTACAAAGFSDLDEVRGARLSPTEIANAESLNRSAADARAAAEAVLADPALAEAAAAPPVELSELERALLDAETEHHHQHQTAKRLAERADRLEQLTDEFTQAHLALRPLRDARDLASSVAAMCAGTATDNATRTRLSHYVLSQRLRQVVAAANARLAAISGGRYELHQRMERGVGDARGGLGLRVHDTYTGHSRDPATLSGGETFYVSLALALGLADLVRDEIGGVELSTLFVDEGFGGLDAETLDEVMDELDSLRSGGRSVGIVSHVPDLKLRIPAQVQVVASPQGSRLVGP